MDGSEDGLGEHHSKLDRIPQSVRGPWQLQRAHVWYIAHSKATKTGFFHRRSQRTEMPNSSGLLAIPQPNLWKD